MMSPSGLHLNKPVLVVIVFVFVLAVIFWMRTGFGSPAAEMAMPEKSTWKTGDWLELPATAKDNLNKVKVEHVKDKKIKVGDKEVTVAYREVKPEGAKLDLLLLHGASFKSQTWQDAPMSTLQVLYNLGYHAVAIDLPGYGDSNPKETVDYAAYMEAVIQELKLSAPVIISPSMSGQFSLAYLFKDAGNVLSRCKGYVPVAPVSTDQYKETDYQALKVPTLIVYGSLDKSLGPASLKYLQLLPNSVIYKVEDGGHPCYLDKPDEFHSRLYTFLSSLQH